MLCGGTRSHPRIHRDLPCLALTRLRCPALTLAAIPLTEDHKPDRVDERDRVESKGGTVVWAGTWRVSGVLAVSRSFGNRMMKHLIIPHPEIREDILHGGESWAEAGQVACSMARLRSGWGMAGEVNVL